MRPQVVHPIVRQRRLPRLVVVVHDAAEVAAERERVKIVLRVVEAETAPQDRPVLLHAEKNVGKSRVAGRSAAERLAVRREAPERTRAHDLLHELRARRIGAVALKHTCFVVVGLRGEECVLSRKLERLVIALQFIVAHDLIHHVAVAALREIGGPLDAQTLALRLKLVAFRHDLRISHALVVGVVVGDFKLAESALHVGGLLLDGGDLLLALFIVHPGLELLVHRDFNLVDRLFGLFYLHILKIDFAVDKIVDATLERQERRTSDARQVEGKSRDLRERLHARFGQRVLELLDGLKGRLHRLGVLLARRDVVFDLLLRRFRHIPHLRGVVESGQLVDEALQLLVRREELVGLHVDLGQERRIAVERDLHLALGLALAVEVLRLRREAVLAHIVARDPRRVRPGRDAELVGDLAVQQIPVRIDDRDGKRVVGRAHARVLAPRVDVGADLFELILIPRDGADDDVPEESVVRKRLVAFGLEGTGDIRRDERIVVDRHVDVAAVRAVSGLDAAIFAVDAARTVKVVGLHVVVVVDVGSGIPLRIRLARADVVIVRIAVDFDEAALDGGLFIGDHVLEVAGRVLVPETVRRALHTVEDVLRHLRRPARTVHDLLEVRLAGVDFARRDVERNRIVRKPEGIEPRIGIVGCGLYLARACGDRADFERRLAVEHADKTQLVGRAARQERVGDGPVVVGAEVGARRPFVGAPRAGAGAARVILPDRLVLGVEPSVLSADTVVPAERIGHDLLAGAGLRLRRLRKALFVEIADGDLGLSGKDALDLRLPAEIGMPQQRVVALHGGKIVAPCVAVALRIELLRVVDVDDAVRLRGVGGIGRAALVADAVVLHIGNLTAHDVGREVPGETVVERRLPRENRILPARLVLRGHVASAQEAKLLFKDVLALVHEREDGTVGRIIHAGTGAEIDRRVERVGHRLVSERGVEFRDAARRHLQRERERFRRDLLVVDRKLLRLVEHRFVDRDQAAFVERFEIERNVAVVRLARLLEDRKFDVDLVVEEIADLLVERIDRLQNALDPAFRQFRRRPVRPLRADERLHGGIERAVAAAHVVIGKAEHARIADRDPVEHRNARLAAGAGERQPAVVVQRGRTVDRLAVLPFELPILRTPAEVGGVLHVELLVEGIVALHHMEIAVVKLRHDLDDVHGDDFARRDHGEIRRVVEDERHITRAAAGRRQRHLIERRQIVGKHIRFAAHRFDALHPIRMLRAR